MKAEFDDLSLMKAMAAEERGFIALPTIAMNDAVARYGYQIIGNADDCRIEHPAVVLVTNKARVMLGGSLCDINANTFLTVP